MQRQATPSASLPVGVTSAARATSANAASWTASRRPPASASPNTRMPPMMQVRFAAVEVVGDDRDGVALLEAAGGGEEGERGGDGGDGQPGGEDEREQAVAGGARERLQRDVADAEQHAGGGAEQRAVVMGRGAHLRRGDQQQRRAASATASKAIRPGTANAVWCPSGAGIVRTSSTEPDRGHRDAGPLAAADAVAEDAVAEHREDHDAGGEHDLHRRERGERERGDVQDPGADGDRHADREPLGGEQRPRAGQRPPQRDERRAPGAAVLAQEAQLRDDGAYERQRDPKLQLRPTLLEPTVPRTLGRSLSARRAAVIGRGANVARAALAVPTTARRTARRSRRRTSPRSACA